MKCLQCKKETNNPKFCSRSCSAKYNNRKYPKRKKRTWLCKNCSKKTLYRRKYCDECYLKLYKPKNRTKGELRGSRNYQYHSQIRQMARSSFPLTGMCQRCSYNKHTHLCHLVPIKDFPDTATIEQINSLENLIELCPNCHWELDHLGFPEFDHLHSENFSSEAPT